MSPLLVVIAFMLEAGVRALKKTATAPGAASVSPPVAPAAVK